MPGLAPGIFISASVFQERYKTGALQNKNASKSED
jgi:hypothetical protein